MEKNILILGGSSGIGEALVRLAAKDSNQLMFTYFQNQDKAKVIERETGAEARFYDQAKEDSINDLIDYVATKNFDVLVNNAVEPYKRENLLELSVDDFLQYLGRGIRGAFKVCQAFASSVVKRNGSGKIVHVLSSVVMGFPPEKQASYIALKYAWLGLMRAQAVEFKKLNIQVNAVSPSMTRTPLIADLPERFVKMLEQTLPMGRIATPEEVAGVIHFLISSESSYIHGANIPVTGGANVLMNPDRFEQLYIGQESVFSHQITDEDVQKFIELTGDINPLHLDDQFAVQRSFEKRVIHGMLTASFVSTVIGTQLPGPGSLWYEHSFRFLRPVYVGQTIQVEVRVRHKSNAQRVVALDVHVYGEGGEVVLEGEAKVKVLNPSKVGSLR